MLVGKKAPSFNTEAFHNEAITKVNLEDYKGQWVVICFYPRDFTYV